MKKIFVLAGPSGVGKTQVFGEFLKSIKIPELRSHTTRKPRMGEINGVTYFFTNKEEFKKIDFIEKNPYSKEWYGLSRKEVKEKLEKHDKVFVIMERKGIMQLLSDEEYKDMIEVIYIYSTPRECAKRMIKDRNYIDAIDRLVNSLQTHEFQHMDIADHIIRNKEGEQERALKKLDFIVNSIF